MKCLHRHGTSNEDAATRWAGMLAAGQDREDALRTLAGEELNLFLAGGYPLDRVGRLCVDLAIATEERRRLDEENRRSRHCGSVRPLAWVKDTMDEIGVGRPGPWPVGAAAELTKPSRGGQDKRPPAAADLKGDACRST